jgi:hypothetical protein
MLEVISLGGVTYIAPIRASRTEGITKSDSVTWCQKGYTVTPTGEIVQTDIYYNYYLSGADRHKTGEKYILEDGYAMDVRNVLVEIGQMPKVWAHHFMYHGACKDHTTDEADKGCTMCEYPETGNFNDADEAAEMATILELCIDSRSRASIFGEKFRNVKIHGTSV